MAFNESQQMKKDFRLPMVPGTGCGEEMMRRNYHKGHVVGARPDCATTYQGVPQDQTLNPGATATQNMNTTTNRGLSKEDCERLAGKVLRFFAYTVEAVAESSAEKERVRKVSIQYYLEDNTMSVTEPKQENSGIAFGANLKRHVVPTPDGTPITFQNFQVGEPITFYGATYMIYDADAFTREFMNSVGQELAPAFDVPQDLYTTMRNRPAARSHDVESLAAGTDLDIMLKPDQVRATQQFLANDRKVLRCDCTWDDSASLHGYKHYLTLYYFLSDGSFALVEKDTQNSGRDPYARFFSRQKIARPTDPSGKFDSSTLGSVTFKENKNTDYYSDKDVRIGNVLDLYGRKVKIHDYNQFTKDYLEQTFGITDHTPIPGAVPPAFVPPGTVRREATDGEVHERHQKKQQDLRKHKFATAAVKFLMRLNNDHFEDKIRRFVLAFYPADNSIAIYEPVIRNSGIVGGKFLQRQQVRAPSGEYFTSDDFFVGAQVTINKYAFIILKADERSLNYMESNAEEFSHSDINRIVRKMQAMLTSKTSGLAEAFHQADQSSKSLDMATFLSIFQQLKLDMTEQEVQTVLRYFDRNNESYVSFEEVASRVLPEGAKVASDDRPWKEIYEQSLKQDKSTFVVDEKDEENKREAAARTEAAAAGAKTVLELFDQRRQLFMKELHAVVDYAKDSLIGTDEFKRSLRQKLQVESDALPDDQLNALCGKLFPPKFQRVSYEELMRLFNGTSTLHHTLKLIAEKKSS